MSLPLPPPFLPPPLPPVRTKARVLSVEDFIKPGEPSHAEYMKAVCQLQSEGVTLAKVRADGGHAAHYLDKVMQRARKLHNTKPLPLPPMPRKPLPLPPMPRKPLPLPGQST